MFIMKDCYIFLLGLIAGGAISAQGDTIYSNDFDDYSKSASYSVEDWGFDWLQPDWESGVSEGRVEIVEGQEARNGSGACLAVHFPEGIEGTKGSGAQWKMEFYGSYSKVELSYWVKFGEDFDFVRGGKLPGLAGGSAPSGRARSSFEKGWAARLMWRTDDLTAASNGEHTRTRMCTYLKHPTSGFDNEGKDEDLLFWNWSLSGSDVRLSSDKWYRITQVITMNDPGKANGRVEAWVGKSHVLSESGYEFRDDLDLGSDQLFFSVFFGGGDSSWETSKDEVIYFDDIQIKVLED